MLSFVQCSCWNLYGVLIIICVKKKRGGSKVTTKYTNLKLIYGSFVMVFRAVCFKGNTDTVDTSYYIHFHRKFERSVLISLLCSAFWRVLPSPCCREYSKTKMTLTCLERNLDWLIRREEVMHFQKRAEISLISSPGLPLGVIWFLMKISICCEQWGTPFSYHKKSPF